MFPRFLALSSLLIAAAASAAPDPTMQPTRDETQADVIVSGVVRVVYTFEHEIKNGKMAGVYTDFVLAVEVAKVEKGTGLKPGDLVYARGFGLKEFLLGADGIGGDYFHFKDGKAPSSLQQLAQCDVRLFAFRGENRALCILFPKGVDVGRVRATK